MVRINKKIFILILVIIQLSCDAKKNDNIEIKENPLQEKIELIKIEKDGYNIYKIFKYNIKARVLNKKNYSDNLSISKTDLALGWNEMSILNNIEKIKIRQNNRWYYWNVNDFFITRKTIEENSANVHLIAKNDNIQKKIDKIDKKDIVEITGYLVNVSKNNLNWKTSTKRNDTGGGACEIIFVEDIKIIF